MKSSFISPSIEYPLLWSLDFAFPVITKLAFNLEGVEISKEDEARLKNFKDKRLLYISNHPTSIEPPIAYYVASRMGTRFYYMASRNVFTWGFGVVGELIKRIGAFSVLSGGADRDALKMSRKILSDPSGKLVIYPEGMMSGENDNLVPFMPGIAQIGIWGLEDAKKKDPKAEIFVLPAFVKYKLTGSRESKLREIETSLARIEGKLKVFPGGRTLLRRFLTVGRVILEQTEFELGIPKSEIEGKDFDYRLGRARHAALNKAGRILNIQFQDTENAIVKIRELFTALDSWDAGMPLPSTPKEIGNQEIQKARKLVDMAYTFLITKPKNLISYPSSERLMEWIYSFERHLFGTLNYRPRKAHVLLGEVFSLEPYYQTYQTNKKQALIEIMAELRKRMEAMVESGKNLTEPLIPPYSVGMDLEIG